MKTRGFAVRSIASCLLLAACHVQAETAGPDSISREEMAAKVRASRSMQPASSQPIDGETPVIQRAPVSLLDSSQILAANGQWAVVPKGAVIHVPKTLASHVVAAPAGTMVPWTEFLLSNRSWLSNLEITIEQAAGKNALKPEVIKSWAVQNKVVVATYQGGAISCRNTTPAQP